MEHTRYISVTHRRALSVGESDAHLLPLLEPLFLIDTHMYFEERIHLFKLALALREGFVACEIGSYLGASTSFLAAAASLRKGHVHAVDTWQNDAMPHEPVENTFERFQENTRPFQHLITIHRGRADAVKDEVPAVDLLFIDGDHSYEATKVNLADYAGKLKPGGVLALHDFTYETVSRALRDTFKLETLGDLGRVLSLQALRVL